MKKFILGLVATAAIASPIAMAASANAATTDVNGVVTVSKGDVQDAMDWNNELFQQNAANVEFTATSSVTGYGDEAHMIQSPTTGEWHDYGYSNPTGSVTKPEDVQWAAAWGFEGDVWEPAKATVTVEPVTNKGRIISWT
jgi:hypothetical protein